jgi:hypothetical protein
MRSHPSQSVWRQRGPKLPILDKNTGNIKSDKQEASIIYAIIYARNLRDDPVVRQHARAPKKKKKRSNSNSTSLQPISLVTPTQKKKKDHKTFPNRSNPPKTTIEYPQFNPVNRDSIPTLFLDRHARCSQRTPVETLAPKQEMYKTKETRDYCGNMAAISSSVKTMSCTGSCLRSRSCDS